MIAIKDFKPVIPSIDLLISRLQGVGGEYLSSFVEKREVNEKVNDERIIGKAPQAGNVYVFEWSLL